MSVTLTQITAWAHELGFQRLGVSRAGVEYLRTRHQAWLDEGYAGSMDWLGEHMDKRFDPAQLVQGARTVISVRMDYLTPDTAPVATLKDLRRGYVARYALGRDYHKLMRRRLAQLCQRIEAAAGSALSQRPFVDSAPIPEREYAQRAGLGWIGKHTLLLSREGGSFFFLGEIFTSLELPETGPAEPEGCGDCTACLKVCPTDAFPAPYVLDARRCIAYLTIEHAGPIDPALRPALGNRVFGCDDCQLICPWNKHATTTSETDFKPRHGLDNSALAELFTWDEATFLKRTEGSAIRRAGFERWQRNLAVALGNAPPDLRIEEALSNARGRVSAMVDEHIDWALARQRSGAGGRRVKLKRVDR